MKLFTKNQLRFAAVLLVLTIGLRYGLSNLLELRQFPSAWIVAGLYAVLVFIAGWYFGKKDNEFLPLYNIGFRLHATTYLICNTVAEVWFFLGLNSQYEEIKSVHLTVLFWGLGLLLHLILMLYTRKNVIMGIDRSEIFD
jgi:hypothetical protein